MYLPPSGDGHGQCFNTCPQSAPHIYNSTCLNMLPTFTPIPNCKPGFYKDTNNSCQICPSGSYCVDNIKNMCVENQYSEPGSEKCSDCSEYQYSALGASNCSDCPSKIYNSPEDIKNICSKDCQKYILSMDSSFKPFVQCYRNCPSGYYTMSDSNRCINKNSGGVAKQPIKNN